VTDYRVTLTTADNALVRASLAPFDPFARQTRCLLQSDHLFERGHGRERRQTLAAAGRIKDEHGRPIPNFLPMAAHFATVEKGDPARPGGYYRARYRIDRLPFQPVTLALPVGGGNTEYGDFADWEGQPFSFEFAPDPWEAGFVFVALRDVTPFPDDSEAGLMFCRALARTHWNPYRWGVHVLGRNLSYARTVLTEARTYPAEDRKAKAKPARRALVMGRR
jgi:hypothetical protein